MGELIAKGFGEHAVVACSQLRPHIDYVHFGKLKGQQVIRLTASRSRGAVREDAVWQVQQGQFTPAGVVVLRYARSGAAEQQGGAGDFREFFGGLNGVIERRSLGFGVRVVVTFIDHNQSELWHGNEQGAA